MTEWNNCMRGWEFFSLVLCLILLSGVSCSKNDISCGAGKIITLTYIPGDPSSAYFIRNDDAVFKWTTDYYIEVCPLDAVDINASIFMLAHPFQSVKTKMYAEYGTGLELEITRSEMVTFGESVIDKYSDAFSLTDSYGPDPASFRISFEIIFDSFGSYQTDSSYLSEVWFSTEMLIAYAEFN